MRIRHAPLWLALACGLAPAPWAFAQGTIAYHRPTEPLAAWGRELDLDDNGQAEVRFFDGSYGGFYYGINASGIGNARLLVTPRGPHDLGSYLIGVNEGFSIGESTQPFLFWAAHDAPNLYGRATVAGYFIPEEGDHVIPDGDFYGTTACMGVHFQIGSDWHYGWVRIRGAEWLTLGATAIVDWAYETRPDMPILAGAIPEPAGLALLLLGALALFAGRWRP